MLESKEYNKVAQEEEIPVQILSTSISTYMWSETRNVDNELNRILVHQVQGVLVTSSVSLILKHEI